MRIKNISERRLVINLRTRTILPPGRVVRIARAQVPRCRRLAAQGLIAFLDSDNKIIEEKRRQVEARDAAPVVEPVVEPVVVTEPEEVQEDVVPEEVAAEEVQEEPAEVEEVEEVAEEVDLSTLKVADLKKMAIEKGHDVKGLKKDDILKLLTEE